MKREYKQISKGDYFYCDDAFFSQLAGLSRHIILKPMKTVKEYIEWYDIEHRLTSGLRIHGEDKIEGNTRVIVCCGASPSTRVGDLETPQDPSKFKDCEECLRSWEYIEMQIEKQFEE